MPVAVHQHTQRILMLGTNRDSRAPCLPGHTSIQTRRMIVVCRIASTLRMPRARPTARLPRLSHRRTTVGSLSPATDTKTNTPSAGLLHKRRSITPTRTTVANLSTERRTEKWRTELPTKEPGQIHMRLIRAMLIRILTALHRTMNSTVEDLHQHLSHTTDTTPGWSTDP